MNDRAGRAVALLRDLVDPSDCWFDHRGGCQAHGYLSLKPGEKCPHAEAKELLAEEETPRVSSEAPAPLGQGKSSGAGHLCATPGCGHSRAAHDLAKDKRTRTGCSRLSGPKATPCPHEVHPRN